MIEEQDKAIKEMESKTEEVKIMNLQVEEYQTAMQQNESDLEDARTELYHSKVKIVVLEKNLLAEQKEKLIELENLENEMNEKAEQSIEDINQSNLEEGRLMLVDFEQGQRFLKVEIAGLNKEYISLSLS
jgi:hypothetical protein